MEMDRKCCFVVFQQGANLMWQLLQNMLLFQIVCLQIGGSQARVPTINMSFVSNGDMFSRCIDCFSHCSTLHMLLIIIYISSMIMTFAFFRCSMTLLDSGRIKKYLHVGIQNAMHTIMIVELKWNVATHVILNNNIFWPSNWKCYVMYFIRKVLPLPCVPMIMCKLFGFSIMECNIFFLYHLIAWWKCLWQICVVKVGNKLDFIWLFVMKKESIVCLWCVYFGSRYRWSLKISSSNFFSMSKRFIFAHFIRYVCKLSNDGRN